MRASTAGVCRPWAQRCRAGRHLKRVPASASSTGTVAAAPVGLISCTVTASCPLAARPASVSSACGAGADGGVKPRKPRMSMQAVNPDAGHSGVDKQSVVLSLRWALSMSKVRTLMWYAVEAGASRNALVTLSQENQQGRTSMSSSWKAPQVAAAWPAASGALPPCSTARHCVAVKGPYSAARGCAAPRTASPPTSACSMCSPAAARVNLFDIVPMTVLLRN